MLFEQPVTQWPAPFWAVLLGLQQVYTMEGKAMETGLTVELVLEIGEALRKQVVASASPKERLVGLAPEELLVVRQQLETMLAEQVNPLQVEQAAALLAQRQTLLHILHHKFGDIPAALRQQIETTTNANQLTLWLDQALDAPSLAALAFVTQAA